MIDLSTMKNVFTCDGMTRGTAAGTTVWSAKLGLIINEFMKCIVNYRDCMTRGTAAGTTVWSAKLG